MITQQNSQKSVHLLPGDWFIATVGEIVVTVLGSCVATCLYDPVTKIAGVNHFMLPGDAGTDREGNAKFGVYSMELMITDLQRHGVQRANLEAKVFGGGSVLDSVASAHIGEKNVAFALDYLERERIPITARDLLGMKARKLLYDASTNRAFVKYVTSRETKRVVEEESSYSKRAKPKTGTVELF
jgi:chemotaxis protein CheD